MLLEQIEKLNVAIWGFGVEGQAASEYLLLRCPGLKVSILCSAHEISEGCDSNLVFVTQAVDATLLSEFDVVIKSPGITPYQKAVSNASCEIISSSALWFSNEKSGHVIAVTGTKGKSTTCAMLAAILTAKEHRVILAGNIGVPLISCLDQYDYVILETSSYQAQDGLIKADFSVILNLYPEHLNWHLSEDQYFRDKWQLIQQSKHVLLNQSDKKTSEMLKQFPINTPLRYFQTEHGFYELNGVLMYQDKALLSHYGWLLKGRHNLVNAAAVCAIINWLNLDLKHALNVLKQFKPLPHRLQEVKHEAGITYIDDSISSTPHATMAAISTVDSQKTILLVGGYDRGIDWAWWVEAIAQELPKMIICSGENGKKIHQHILNQSLKTQCIWQPNLKSAVKLAQQHAKSGDYVLLSPGAPSFDAFDDYQHRGQQFVKWLN